PGDSEGSDCRGSGAGVNPVCFQVVVQFGKEASQTRDYCVARNATHRAARPDPSLRKERLLRMTIKLHHYRCPPLLATRTHLLLQSKINYGLILQCDRSSCPEYRRAVDPAGGQIYLASVCDAGGHRGWTHAAVDFVYRRG